MYQRKVNLDMLNAVKIKSADVSSLGPSSDLCFDEGLTLETSANLIVYGVQHIQIILTSIRSVVPLRRRRPKLVLTGTSIPLCLGRDADFRSMLEVRAPYCNARLVTIPYHTKFNSFNSFAKGT